MTGTIQVLLVEDNQADVDLTRESLGSSKLRLELSVVSDGVKAIDYLRGQGEYGNAVRPDLVLLDLNLPRRDGREVLAEMKADRDLRRIPVVVLTSSDAESDVIRSYDLGANCYVTKPVGLRQLRTVVAEIESFWFSIVKLPQWQA